MILMPFKSFTGIEPTSGKVRCLARVLLPSNQIETSDARV